MTSPSNHLTHSEMSFEEHSLVIAKWIMDKCTPDHLVKIFEMSKADLNVQNAIAKYGMVAARHVEGSVLLAAIRCSSTAEPALTCIARGADVNVGSSVNNNKPLQVLRNRLTHTYHPCFDFASVYEALKQHGATATHGQTSILHQACRHSYPELIQSCLQFGQDLRKKDAWNRSAFGIAIEKMPQDLIIDLIESFITTNPTLSSTHSTSKWIFLMDDEYLGLIAFALCSKDSSGNYYFDPDTQTEVLDFLSERSYHTLFSQMLKNPEETKELFPMTSRTGREIKEVDFRKTIKID